VQHSLPRGRGKGGAVLEYVCPHCGKRLPRYYVNHAKADRGYGDYWGDRGRYNYSGAAANMRRHVATCKARAAHDSAVPGANVAQRAKLDTAKAENGKA